MTSLVYKEFVQLRAQILQVLGMMLVAVLFVGRISKEFAMSFMFALPTVLSMTLPQMIFEQEERGNTFVFLRALPIRPSEIVVAKYLVSAITTVATLAIMGLAGVTGILTKEAVLASIFGVGLISFALSGLSLFLHFLLGAKPAKVALILVTFALAVPAMLVAKGRGGIGEAFAGTISRIQPLATSYAGVCLSLVAGLAMLAVSCAISAWIFTKRDLSRLP